MESDVTVSNQESRKRHVAGQSKHTARDRVEAEITALCRGQSMDNVRELSDPAALLIAAGKLGPEISGIVERRIRSGLGFPGIGGYFQLRILSVQLNNAQEVANSRHSQVLRLPARGLAAETQRKLDGYRAMFVRGGGYFPTRGRAIRRDREAGVYLDPTQREQLFKGLMRTPTVRMIKLMPTNLVSLGSRIVGSSARGARNWQTTRGAASPQYTGSTVAGQRGAVGGGAPVPDSVPKSPLPEMYTASILVAGILYDRLMLAYRYGGLDNDEIRLQFNAEHELAYTAADLAELRHAGMAVADARETIRRGFSRETGLGNEFDVIWDEVIDRIAAFREIVELAESRAQSAVAARTAKADSLQLPGFPAAQPAEGLEPMVRGQLDNAAKSLNAAGGERQISIDSMRRLRESLKRPEGPTP